MKRLSDGSYVFHVIGAVVLKEVVTRTLWGRHLYGNYYTDVDGGESLPVSIWLSGKILRNHHGDLGKYGYRVQTLTYSDVATLT